MYTIHWCTETARLIIIMIDLHVIEGIHDYVLYTVQPPNKGHIGDNINSLDLSFVERLSSSRRLSVY